MLVLKNLRVKVGKMTIIKDINFNFEKGKMYAIMGPNGSGKSTLAFAIAGHPAYKLESGSMRFEGRNISELSPDKRAKLGMFLSFQTPLALSGINVFQLLRIALANKKDPLALKKKIETIAKKLGIKSQLAERSLNEGASGGEKKKLEMLQAAILDPKLLIFDEIDTGVDVDALRTIAKFMNENKDGKTYILITHYNRILHYIRPDKVLILMNGRLMKVGSAKLAEEIEKSGYEKIMSNVKS
ncbi:Fe-S cluster assembly ATPase SufC [Candidatus Roizmanbacteria bacterium RIFCSPLOWO2_01_FULL_37_13]|uniref:Fe-S cluster assembly ATPase SufC n=1 Tax=Candidatus Roizmanbacteria bacterium RIFCSPHIGHO2_02_FULL_38_11 TaxID=1802039 RepID=A0A1F7H408_9BACT|nr:MAG: Fe-S cluster assembly ATPase SufC [Candidatus Roizmanbacteria bacterium RIFCSPHIGHO2_02_FULL_38_11]OGK33863.1 MAG: Fe-S cluster assembly ATPase SufC [Candidatus Roizmanbacteria bacterium RIFCSPHIGHO2_12_FULL_37_9b]OGK42325.1 MAG: Fe-S cluster assembly ATPase SufC [Candidatus Roizmanbacteria bacterium RIFCSPLOWO2_01_FULL_37_13]